MHVRAHVHEGVGVGRGRGIEHADHGRRDGDGPRIGTGVVRGWGGRLGGRGRCRTRGSCRDGGGSGLDGGKRCGCDDGRRRALELDDAAVLLREAHAREAVVLHEGGDLVELLGIDLHPYSS